MTVRDPSGLATDVVVAPAVFSVALAEESDLPTIFFERTLPSLSILVTVLGAA